MINFNNFGKNYVWKIVAVAGVLAFMLAGQVSEAGKPGKGPRASLGAATTCALDVGLPGSDIAVLTVSTALTNKSSGDTIPEVTKATIDGTYKPEDEKGNVNIVFDSRGFGNQGEVYPTLTIFAEFDLCSAEGVDANGNIGFVIDLARELNGKSTVYFRISDDEKDDPRPVTSRCTDNPDTEDNEGGIYLEDWIDRIEDACD